MIRSLYIHNYKCFSNFAFRPESGSPLMIIGRNGVGKSSLGKALMLLRDYAEGRDLSAYFAETELSVFAPLAPVEFEAEVEVGDSVSKLRLVFQPDRTASQGYRIVEESVDDRVRVSLKGIEVIRPSPDRMSSRIEVAERGVHLDGSCANVVTWFAVHESVNRQLRDEFVKSFACAFEDFVDYSYELKGDGQHLKLRFKSENMPEVVLDFDQLSDGEKCRFVASAISAVNKNSQGLICFWDEPDNFVTTSEEASIFYALGNAFLKQGQLIVTSHSELGILTFNDVETYVFDRRNHASPILPPLSIADLRRDGRLTGSLQDALISGGISL